MNRVVLLTGASGFLGKAMLEALARTRPHDRFVVLSRAASVQALRERFAWIDKERLQFVQGDLSQDNLGLSTSDRSILLDKTTEIWHLAACTTFDDGRAAEIFSTNVEGTSRLLELARQARKLENFYFTSTAYVVGVDRLVTPEDELPKVKRFNNTYEASKWQGEKLVRSSGLPFTIFRPSIIMDRSDGTCEGDPRMVYGYLLGLYFGLSKYFRGKGVTLKNHLSNGHFLECDFRMIGNYPITKNFVCLDDVVSTMMAVINSPVPHQGRTYNVTNPTPLLGRQMSQAVEGAFRVKGLRWVGNEVVDPTPAEEFALRQTQSFSAYLTHSDPEWPMCNTKAAINGHHRLHMTPELFTFLIKAFIEQCVVGGGRKSRNGSKSRALDPLALASQS